MRLARAGHEPLVVDANAEHVAILNTLGLELNDERTKLQAVTPDDLDRDDFDLVLLAVRSDATEAALAPVARTSADVLSLQNGLNEDKIARVVGAGRTIGCVVGFGATWIDAGRISLDAEGPLTLGRLDGSTDERVESAARLLRHAFPTKVTTNVRGALWGKMLVNSTTVLGALGGMLTRDLLSTPERRKIVGQIVAEGIAVARSEQVTLGRVFGVDPDEWPERSDDALARFAEQFGAIKSVTWRDFELGRRTEIDAVTGEIVRRGSTNGVPTPLSAGAFSMLKEIEAGEREPAPANLDALRA